MTSILLLIACAICGLLIASLFIWLAGIVVRSPKMTLRRAILTALLIWATSLIAWMLAQVTTNALRPDQVLMQLFITVLILLACIAYSIVIAGRMSQVGLWRGSVVFLGYVLGCGAALVLVSLLVRPYVSASFIVTSNSMAPSLVAFHRWGSCPECGGELTIPQNPPEPLRKQFALDELGICAKCLKVNRPKDIFVDLQEPDRFIVNKLLSPRRWDIVVYQFSHEPDELYVARLVGLPGEKVLIKEGGVWADGSRLQPPEPLANLRYVASPRGPNSEEESEPIILKEGECWLLVDFSSFGQDSRVFGPVAMKSIVGVVDLVYWPRSRIRILR
jgi:signal peptidase I